ncbi:MAG: Sua5/YciO/YrdC/YwlC family protein [Halomonadaceae bacterium]|nr:MAG: Sua5/YciO/YrdC/YwlC family protein [Halomonadaceae bacterium]
MAAVSNSQWWHLRRGAGCLRQGGVLAYPTEAVWGLGCDPWSRVAVERLLELKSRPVGKGLILVAADEGQLEFLLAGQPAALREAASRCWQQPRAVSLLLPDPEGRIPPWIRGDHDQVLVRVSHHPQVQALCRAFGGPVVSSSCNPAGRQPARYSWQVQRYFRHQLDGVLPGSTGQARRPSVILDPLSGRQLRA